MKRQYEVIISITREVWDEQKVLVTAADEDEAVNLAYDGIYDEEIYYECENYDEITDRTVEEVNLVFNASPKSGGNPIEKEDLFCELIIPEQCEEKKSTTIQKISSLSESIKEEDLESVLETEAIGNG